MKSNAHFKIAALVASAFALPAIAQTVDLSSLGWVQYGDAQSYSMPIANYQYGYKTNTGPFAIDSTPGAIKDLIVVATGSEGSPVTTNFSGMDDAYSTPTGKSGSTSFMTETATYRGTTGTVTNNLDTTWDASLASMEKFLAGEQMAIFFNNNQVNSNVSADQSLAAWAQIWITDANDKIVGSVYELVNKSITPPNTLKTGTFDLITGGGGGTFLGDVTKYTGSGLGNPTGSLTGTTDWVLSGGAICVLTGPGIVAPVPVPCNTTPGTGQTVSSPINHNLGADHVAYTLMFPELNTLMAGLFNSTDTTLDLTKYTLHADIRMGCQGTAGNWMACGINNGFGDALNNGYEQIFIGTARVYNCPPDDPQCNPTVPEPESLLLVALGLLSMGGLALRRNRKQTRQVN